MTLDEHNYFQMHKKEDYGTNLKTVFHDLSLQTKNEKEDFSDALSSNVNSRKNVVMEEFFNVFVKIPR